MDKNTVISAIDILLRLFYGEKSNQYVAIRTMELYHEIGVFQDTRLVAEVIEELRAFALLEPIQLFDVVVAQRIEDVLMGC